MNLNGLNLWGSKDLKKIGLIAAFGLFFILFVWQILDFIFSRDTLTENRPQNASLTQPKLITIQSPLFSTPLFGKYVPAIRDLEIKQSTLDVELVGILFSSNPKESQVLIRLKEGEEHTYLVGDTLPGGAKIQQIDRNGILVLYDGALESLSFPKNELLFEKPPKPLIGE